ncbi:MAG TPA: response regulator [Ohtaekwangia sp.]
MKHVIRIMIVANDMTDPGEVRRTLDKRGILYRLNVVNSNEAALQALGSESHNHPDIMLLDQGSSEMFEFVKTVRDNPLWKDIKIFILTTFEEPIDRQSAAELGISGVISKPLKLHSPSTIDAYNLMMDLMNL